MLAGEPLRAYVNSQIRQGEKPSFFGKCRLQRENHEMAVFVIALTEEEQRGVNTETRGALLRAIAPRELCGPITLVVDNAPYQRNAIVMGVVTKLGIGLAV